MRTALLTSLIVFLVNFSSPSCFAQLDVVTAVPSGVKVRKAIESLLPAEQLSMSEARKQVYPVFVFIPGILGSKLTKIQDNDNRQVIWGQINLSDLLSKPNAAIAYQETDQVLAEPLDTFYVAGHGSDIYGNALATMRAMNAGNSENVLWFSYDWRQSNRLSAKNLASWLCLPEQRKKIEGKKVVFIAHSMGGLVLKYWLKHFYDDQGCSSDKFVDWIKVRELVFAGTPSFGAAKAASALGAGTTLLVNATGGGAIWQDLAKIDAATLSKSLNTYGIYFPSAYELLPILRRSDGAPSCLPDRNDRPSILITPQVGESRPADIFSPQTWREIGWPLQLKGTEREIFLNEKLPKLLDSAEKFLCDVGSYRPEERFDVLRFVGDKQKTICLITLTQPAQPGQPYLIREETCPGDGTVPAWIAKEVPTSKRGLSRPNGQLHDDLLGDRDFLGYIDDLNADLVEEFADAAAKTDPDAAAKTFKKLNYPAPTPITGGDSTDAAKSLATKTIESLGIPAEELFSRAAKTDVGKQTSLDRAIAYRRSAEIGQQDPLNGAWALNNSANIYLQRKNFRKAQLLAKQAFDAADAIKSPKDQVAVKDLKSKSALTAAIASKELGLDADAIKFRDLAVSFGNQKAKRLSLSS